MDFDVINVCVLEIKKDKDVLRGLNDLASIFSHGSNLFLLYFYDISFVNLYFDRSISRSARE